MANKGFPSFGMSQAGAFVTALKNYNLPDFILKLVANDTQSELLERGRIADRLQSMNDTALELLNAIFVECQEDPKGKFKYLRKQNYEQWLSIQSEDINIIEGMQDGRKSPIYNGGIFSPIMDNPTHHFHKWVANNIMK